METYVYRARRSGAANAAHVTLHYGVSSCRPKVFTHSFPVVRSLELGGVQLLHLEHRLHCPLRAGRRGILEQVGQETRHHLPGHTELVLEPAALLGVRVAARRELLSAIVDLVLRLAADDQ